MRDRLRPVIAIGATGFFMSIQFPTIFSFGLRDPGDRAMAGASYLVMAIVGGAGIPPIRRFFTFEQTGGPI